MGVSLGVDLSRLDLCFGGFSPTTMGDTEITNRRVAEAEERIRQHYASKQRALQVEASKVSAPSLWTDDAGIVWRYVVLDGAEIRLERCESVPAGCMTLVIPASIEGMPVVALAADCCAFLPDVESVACEGSIVSIGPCAFRGCTALKRAALPASLAQFDSSWFRHCVGLEYLVLPGQLKEIPASLFDIASLVSIRIGEGTSSVSPGAFARSHLRKTNGGPGVAVDAGNPFLVVDAEGGLYARDGEVLLAACMPLASYDVRPGCKMIAKKAFAATAGLERVGLPQSLECIGEHAFAHTALHAFDAPAHLKMIMERAFYDCRHLEEAHFNEGLLFIGRNAFSDTALTRFALPASIERLDHPIADDAALNGTGDDPAFTIGAGSALFLDGRGGLYRKDGASLVFERFLDPHAATYDIAPGTVRIADAAFAGHACLQAVTLPEGMREIGARAFKECTALTEVALPQSLAVIGDEAFFGAGIERFELPASLKHVGTKALVMHGARRGAADAGLRTIAVHDGNPRFRMEGGLLIEHADDGTERVVLYTDADPIVKIPESVTSIAAYAFNGARNIRELWMSDRIAEVEMRGLAVDCRIDLIHVDVAEPIEGHTAFDIRFPETDRGEHQMYLALTVSRFVDIEGLMDHYDNTIVNASNFDSVYDGGLSVYDQGKRILERLLDPVFLSAVNRDMAERFVRTHLEQLCVGAAKHDDRAAIDALVELEFLTGQNIARVIDRVGELQDAAMTGYLLELKRRRFGQEAFDFDL